MIGKLIVAALIALVGAPVVTLHHFGLLDLGKPLAFLEDARTSGVGAVRDARVEPLLPTGLI